jgi:hypothetical protein
MKLKYAYWGVTALFSLMMAASAVMYLTGAPQVVEGFKHLGYPGYFRPLLGVAKLLGVLALWAPVPRTLREWAYAGFVITVTSAAVSHAASGDAAGVIVGPVVALALVLTSHQLWRRVRDGASAQPANRPVAA